MNPRSLLFLAGVSLVACGGSDGRTVSDGGAGSPDGGACTGTGSLAVNVTGLPAGVDAKVTVTGSGSPHTVTATETLTLESGSYTVAADIVTVPDPIVRAAYKASVTEATADVCGGQSASVSVTYTLIPTSNKLWIGNQNGDDNTLGYASSALGTSGTRDATVAAKTEGTLTGAFDRDGNLWLLDRTDVGLKRYPAATLATGGTKTPDIAVSGDALTGGIPGPVSMAFDGHGNVWVGVSYSQKVVEFAAAQLTASTATAVPAVEISNVPAPAALAFDAKGNLWVGTSDDVREYLVDTLSASSSGPPATTILAQSPPPVISGLLNVLGLAFNADGHLWVNYDGTLVLLTTLESGTVTPAIQIKADVLALPEGIALDESGGLWMAYSAGKFCKFGASQLTASGSVAPAVVIGSPTIGSATSPAFFPAPAGLFLYSSLE